LELPAQPRATGGPIHLLVDSSGLKLSGLGEWLVEKHGTSKRRSWRKLHIGFDAVTGRIVASIPTDVDDASQVGVLLDQIAEPVEVFLGAGGYDRTNVYTALDERHPAATVVVPPRADAMLSAMADTPNATATFRRSPRKGEWLGSGTAAIIKGHALRANLDAGSRSSVTRALGDGARGEHGGDRDCGKRLDQHGHCTFSFGSDREIPVRHGIDSWLFPRTPSSPRGAPLAELGDGQAAPTPVLQLDLLDHDESGVERLVQHVEQELADARDERSLLFGRYGRAAGTGSLSCDLDGDDRHDDLPR
jgi:hypothetical protein